MRLHDKVAIITGAGRGIGRATSIKFATEGAKVVVCDMDAESIEETINLCRETRGEVMGYVADVRDMKALDAMVAATVAKWGRVDCLVNNAGIVHDAQLKNMTEDQFERVIAVNLKGVFNCTKAVVNTMLSQQSGVILNASSIVGLTGNFGQTNSAAAKAGLIGMVKTWARELGRKGIRANAVCPGFIGTEILKSMPERVLRALEEKVPLGRMGRPEEVANTFAWLASDEASYVNGAVLEVTGGLTL
ncbi:MAG TPA: beta-ketoacyl-ACP reductase [Burkholderiales bacterium]|nr:beta-ketoacyl-ACP reductase [Burkholderiales bacterium]